MFAAAALGILVTMALILARAFLGPTVYDRILAVNTFGFLTGRPDFLDISLLYALINFIGTVAVLKFFEYRDLGHPGPGREKG